MTRRMLVLLAALTTTSPLNAKTLAYEDNKLNFKSCTGENVSARWFGGSLSLSQPGKSPGDPTPSAQFQTWDGGCATFQWDAATGALVIKQGETAEPGQIVRFVAWDGARWAATRTGGGFYLAKIADKDEQDPKSRMKAAGDWLAKNNILGVPAADLLAEGLSKANGG
jgi:hypothetical protein